MLFNSAEFLFLFLPLALLGFFVLGRNWPRLAAGWLAAASLFFYGWWNPPYVALLLASIVANYALGRRLGRRRQPAVLAFGVVANLALLGYYKYTNFFLDIVDQLTGGHWSTLDIVLPLGISFFTFTQLAFLVDTYRGQAREYDFVHYVLFVTYFPHLIAGPVLHHREMMPQFARRSTYVCRPRNIAVGGSVFVVGLLKKVLVADGMAEFAAPVFDAAAKGLPVGFFDAWGGALAYTLQLYFDFSGYSDMAIGLSLLFGVRLPVNFNSPYQAVNIIDFWRRWHMTLSRFLKDYVYIPLGGNRKGPVRRYLNLLATMLLGGLWHGAGWTYLIWGGLHGVYLAINHAWREWRGSGVDGPWAGFASRALTFVAVVVAWVFFRAEDVSTAWALLEAMAGCTGFVLPVSWLEQAGAAGTMLAGLGIRPGILPAAIGIKGLFWSIPVLAMVWWLPNTQRWMARYRPVLESADKPAPRLAWQPSLAWAITGALGLAAGILCLGRPSEFLYFQF